MNFEVENFFFIKKKMIQSQLYRNIKQLKNVISVANLLEDKNEAAGIMKEKVQEICNLIPAFEKEINWTRGITLEGKDYAKYVFKNGSYFDNIAARESSRGKRRHAGVIEECVGVDGDILSEVIIPSSWGLIMRIISELCVNL